jgi:hypothetical protein
MNRAVACFILILAGGFPAWAQGSAPPSKQVIAYELLDGSYFVDDCLICDRLTVKQPLRGTFDLVVEDDLGTYIRYTVRNVDFTASPALAGEVRLTGAGTYARLEEVARLQDMDLALQVKDSLTNQLAYFTNNTRTTTVLFPLIQVDLTQTNGSDAQTFSLHLMAAPLRELWFSTAQDFVSTNRPAASSYVSAGDLISNRGRVVKRNIELVGRLGVMPIVPDLGLDAMQVTQGGEILYSIPQDVFSEFRGPIQHGDLLSDRGPIVRRNQELMAAFKLAKTNDVGLDAVQLMSEGETWFSIRSNVAVNATLTLGRGDILSDQGRVVQTQRQLLANFQPAIAGQDFGLDAFTVLPSGEIWFSVEEAFLDKVLGPIQDGDLLSNLGYRVFRNEDLVRAFAPKDPTADYGLDAVFVITDTCPPKPPPAIVGWNRTGNLLKFEWAGEGAVFQLETAPDVLGPWTPCNPIVPGLTGEAIYDSTVGLRVFRVQQW